MNDLEIARKVKLKHISDIAEKLGVNGEEIEIASGAGFLIPITGTIMRMPGLPAQPASERIDIDDKGNITGLM